MALSQEIRDFISSQNDLLTSDFLDEAKIETQLVDLGFIPEETTLAQLRESSQIAGNRPDLQSQQAEIAPLPDAQPVELVTPDELPQEIERNIRPVSRGRISEPTTQPTLPEEPLDRIVDVPVETEDDRGVVSNVLRGLGSGFIASLTDSAAGLAGLAGFDDFAQSTRELADSQREFFDADTDRISGTAGSLVGNILSFLVPGGALKAVGAISKTSRIAKAVSSGAGVTTGVGAVGAGYGATDFRRDYEATVRASGEEINEDDADNAELFGAGIGILSEIAAPILILNRLGKPLVDGIIKQTVRESLVEGGGAAVGSFARNLVAADVLEFDPDREVFTPTAAYKSIVEEGGTEAAAGAAVSLLANIFNKRGVTPSVSEPTVTPDQPTTEVRPDDQESDQESISEEIVSEEITAETDDIGTTTEPSGEITSETQGERQEGDQPEIADGILEQQVDDIPVVPLTQRIESLSASLPDEQRFIVNDLVPERRVDAVKQEILDNNNEEIDILTSLPEQTPETLAQITVLKTENDAVLSNSLDNLTDENKNRIIDASDPADLLDYIGVRLDAEPVFTERTNQEFLVSDDSKGDLSGAGNVVFRATTPKSGFPLIETMTTDQQTDDQQVRFSTSGKIFSPNLDVQSELEKGKVVVELDTNKVNGVPVADTTDKFKINKSTKGGVSAIYFPTQASLNSYVANNNINKNFDVENVQEIDGGFKLNAKPPVARLSPEERASLESIREEIFAEGDTQVSPSLGQSSDELSASQRLWQVIPPTDSSGTIERSLFKLQRKFRETKGLPKKFGAPLQQAEYESSGAQDRVAVITDNLLAEVKKLSPEKQILQFDLIDHVIRNRKDKSALDQLSGNTRALVEDLGQEIDLFTQRLIDQGVIDETLSSVLGDNLGTYVLRRYKKFDPAENWNIDTVPQDIKDNALKVIENQFLKEGVKKEDVPAKAQEYMELLLSRGTTQSALSSGKKLGGVNITSFIRRQDLDPAIRELLGEIKDPITNILTTVGKQADVLSKYAAQQTIRELGLKNGYFSSEENISAGHTELLFGEKVKNRPDTIPKKFAGFGKVWVTPEMKAEFDAYYNSNKDGDIFESILNGLSFVSGIGKFNQVILNPPAYIANLLSATGTEVLNGRLLFTNKGVKTAGGTVRRKTLDQADAYLGRNKTVPDLYKTGDQLKLYNATPAELAAGVEGLKGFDVFSPEVVGNELLTGGLVDQNALGADITETMNQGGLKLDETKGDLRLRAAKKLFNKSVGKLSKLYQVPDNVGKANAFVVELDKYMRAFPNEKMSDLIPLAIKDVKMTTQVYHEIPDVVRRLSQRGLLPTYLSFSWELLRNVGNTGRLAGREMFGDNTVTLPDGRTLTSDNNVIASAGARRAAGIAAMVAGSMAVSGFKGEGVEEEDETFFRKHIAPEWLQGKDIGTVSFEDGEYAYFDPSYVTPYSMVLDIFEAGVRNPEESEEDSLSRMFDSFASSFLSKNIAAQVLTSVAKNKKPNGAPIYNEAEAKVNPAKKYGEIIKFMFESQFEPGVSKLYKNIQKAKKGEIGYMGSIKKSEDVYSSLVGLRTQRTDIPTAVEQSFRNFIFDYRDAASIAKGEKPNNVDENKYAQAVGNEDAVKKLIQGELDSFIKDLLKVDKSKSKVDKAFLAKLTKGMPVDLKMVLLRNGINVKIPKSRSAEADVLSGLSFSSRPSTSRRRRRRRRTTR